MKKLSSKKLAALVAISLLAAQASALALEKRYVYYGGAPIAELQILSATEAAGSIVGDSGLTYFDLPDSLVSGMVSATAYWTNILGAGAKNPQPWQITVVGINDYANASAVPEVYDSDGDVADSNYVKEALQQGRQLTVVPDYSANPLDGGDLGIGFSSIKIGKYFGAEREGATAGYWVDTDTLLPTNEQAVDLLGCFRHELGHALGIIIKCEDVTDSNENTLLNAATIRKLYYGSANDWDAHLIDQNKNPLDKDKLVITSEQFKKLQEMDGSIAESDYFIVDQQKVDGTTTGKAYFVGDNVTEALGGATFDGISGLPVNAWELDYDYSYIFEGCHLQTTGMMSHRSYSNYTTFMEAELAVMQDIGYTLDRRAYYGKSIYTSGQTITNTQGYFARNAAGTAYIEGSYSSVPLGVGLHIYGSQNNVTQAADILTNGTGSVGIRVDGYENNLTIPVDTTVSANGRRGMGLLVAYGRNHTIDMAGTLTATGAGGSAAVFDFGSSSNGAVDEYRGSYISFIRVVDAATGDITQSWNPSATELPEGYYNSVSTELNGALVDEFNVSGTLVGSENAIYIGKNALVKNININAGASLKGAITSEWKHFAGGAYDAAGGGEALSIQYEDGYYDYDEYIPDLVTNLNINTDLTYSGSIIGSDNMVLNINSGTFSYSGAADVTTVNIATGAKVVGGSYTVNDMTAAAPATYADAAALTGALYNHGTLSAAADSALIITGNLVSDGTLVGVATGTDVNTIQVSGDATIDGSTAILLGALPGESAQVLEATGAAHGTLVNGAADELAAGTGLLSYYGEVDGNSVRAYAVAQDNLGARTAEEDTGYTAVQNLTAALAGDSRADELRAVYSMDTTPAKRALARIASGGLRGDIAASTQRSHLTNKLVANRLHNLWKTQSVTTLPAMYGAGFAASALLGTPLTEQTLPTSGAVTTGSVTLRTTPPEIDTNTWVSIEKNWGELKGDASYHGQAISAGYDWVSGKNSRAGVFVSHRASSLGADSSSASLHDTRVGYYTGSTHGAVERSLYADIGWQHAKTARYLYSGLTARGRESSNIYEVGGRIGYDLHHDDGRIWHVIPYLAAQGSWLRSKGYTETGAGIFNQQVARATDRYFGAQIGISLERSIRNGSLTIDLGVRHAFSGGELYRSYRYEGDAGHSYTMSSSQDKTHGIASITADTEFARGWHVSANTTLERGAHDHDLSASLALKRMW